MTSATSKKTKRRNIENDSVDDALLEKALAVMNQPNDVCDIFGQYVASELRQMSSISIRNIVKGEITKLLLKYSSSSVIISTSTQSQCNENSTKEYIIVNETTDLILEESDLLLANLASK